MAATASFMEASLTHRSSQVRSGSSIVMSGSNPSAHADQMNNVDINQSAVQMAGIGGNGGHGNIAAGWERCRHFFLRLRVRLRRDQCRPQRRRQRQEQPGGISREVSATPALVRFIVLSTLAIAGHGSVDDAFKAKPCSFRPERDQMAALGGDGGHGNLALGGDVTAHLCPSITCCWDSGIRIGICRDAFHQTMACKPFGRTPARFG